MDRRKLRRCDQLFQQRIVNQLMRAQMRSAMHHAMANRCRLSMPEPANLVEDLFQRMALRVQRIRLI